jgi:hypothetical protein
MFGHVLPGQTGRGLQPERASDPDPGAEKRDTEEVFVIFLRIVTGVVRDRWDYPLPKVSEPLE